jgi:predicted transcriptional regulator
MVKAQGGVQMDGVKEQVVRMIQAMPDNATLDDIMAELFFKLQVDAGLKELDEGKGIPHEEVGKRMSKWLGR